MNLRDIPLTATMLRIALEASNGDESATAWAVWNTAKVDQRLRDALVKELCSSDVIHGPTLAELEQTLRKELDGDQEATATRLSELMDPRENPSLVRAVGDEAGQRFVAAFTLAVRTVAADWRNRQRGTE